jgi:hypothetical protein
MSGNQAVTATSDPRVETPRVRSDRLAIASQDMLDKAERALEACSHMAGEVWHGSTTDDDAERAVVNRIKARMDAVFDDIAAYRQYRQGNRPLPDVAKP